MESSAVRPVLRATRATLFGPVQARLYIASSETMPELADGSITLTVTSLPGDTVLDPFLGSGQTAKVALALGRHAVGYDIERRYVTYAHARLQEPLQLRAQQLVARFEKVPLGAPRGYLKRQRPGGKTRHGAGRPTRKPWPQPS